MDAALQESCLHPPEELFCFQNIFKNLKVEEHGIKQLTFYLKLKNTPELEYKLELYLIVVFFHTSCQKISGENNAQLS